MVYCGVNNSSTQQGLRELLGQQCATILLGSLFHATEWFALVAWACTLVESGRL